MINIFYEDKADHSGVASDQIRSPALEDANIFVKFGHQSGVVLDAKKNPTNLPSAVGTFLKVECPNGTPYNCAC